MTNEPEEPTRPSWLLTDPTSMEPVTAETPPFWEGSGRESRPDSSQNERAAAPSPPSAPSTPSTRRAALVGALAGAVAAAAVSLGVVALTDDDDEVRPTTVPPIAVANGQALDVHAVLEEVQDAVVAINVEGVNELGFVGEGAGSGMVLEPDGLILTNNHVIEGATSISVTLADGREVDADLVGSLPSNDIALVRARDVEDLATVTLGESSDLRVGDPVVAIGNALGLGGTPSVTAGIVSALGRELETGRGVELTDLIQTDTAIYQGNSGGPLVNAHGEVIGVNTAVAASQANGAAENLGFALPIDQLEPLIEELKEGGGEIVAGAFLGVRTSPLELVSGAVLRRLGIETDRGAFVTDVVPGSGAEDAGIEAGDVILSIDGEEVEDPNDVGEIIAELEPGDRIEIVVERGGEERTIRATLGSRGVTR